MPMKSHFMTIVRCVAAKYTQFILPPPHKIRRVVRESVEVNFFSKNHVGERKSITKIKIHLDKTE